MDDAEAFFQMTRDPDMQEYLPGTCSDDTIEETRHRIETTYSRCDFKHDFYLLIEENADNDYDVFLYQGK